MRTWHTATVAMKCGYDARCTIPAGASYCLIEGQGWKKIRCQQHTSESQTVGQQQLQVHGQGPSSFIAAKELAKALPHVQRFDPKLAQSGDAE